MFVLWLIYGGIAGWVASIFMRKNAQMGIFANIVVGIVGSYLGGWIAFRLGYGSFSIFDFRGMLVAIAGAMLLLGILNFIRR